MHILCQNFELSRPIKYSLLMILLGMGTPFQAALANPSPDTQIPPIASSLKDPPPRRAPSGLSPIIENNIFTTNQGGFVYDQVVKVATDMSSAAQFTLDFPMYEYRLGLWYKFLQVDYHLFPSGEDIFSFTNSRTRVLFRWYKSRTPIYYSCAGFERKQVGAVDYNGFYYYSIFPQLSQTDVFIVENGFSLLFREPDSIVLDGNFSYGKQINLKRDIVLIPSVEVGIATQNFAINEISFGVKLRVAYTVDELIPPLMLNNLEQAPTPEPKPEPDPEPDPETDPEPDPESP